MHYRSGKRKTEKRLRELELQNKNYMPDYGFSYSYKPGLVGLTADIENKQINQVLPIRSF
jgi:hypothetical protein